MTIHNLASLLIGNTERIREVLRENQHHIVFGHSNNDSEVVNTEGNREYHTDIENKCEHYSQLGRTEKTNFTRALLRKMKESSPSRMFIQKVGRGENALFYQYNIDDTEVFEHVRNKIAQALRDCLRARLRALREREGSNPRSSTSDTSRRDVDEGLSTNYSSTSSSNVSYHDSFHGAQTEGISSPSDQSTLGAHSELSRASSNRGVKRKVRDDEEEEERAQYLRLVDPLVRDEEDAELEKVIQKDICDDEQFKGNKLDSGYSPVDWGLAQVDTSNNVAELESSSSSNELIQNDTLDNQGTKKTGEEIVVNHADNELPQGNYAWDSLDLETTFGKLSDSDYEDTSEGNSNPSSGNKLQDKFDNEE